MYFIKSIFSISLFLFFLSACSDQDESEAAQFFLKGNLKLASNDPTNAIHYYDEALQKKADFADAHSNRGIAYLRLGENEKAMKDFNKAIEIDKKFDQAYFNRAGALIDKQAFTEAALDLEQIRIPYQDSTNYYLKWGDLKFGQGYYDQALAEYDRSIVIQPKNVQALVNRGVAQFEKKNFKAAKTDFENALALDSLQELAYNNLSLLFARESQFNNALKMVNRALDFDPVNPVYLNNKGYIFLLQNQLDEAKLLIDKSLSKNDQNSYAYRNLGLYFLRKKQNTEALTAFQKAYKLNPATDQIHYWLGKALFINNQKNEACTTWRKGATLGDVEASNQWKKYCK